MLSRSAFNAMLKTLEEPPEHVKFILATTDPQKVPVTVLSRCLQFNLKQIPVPQIRDQLEQVLGAEGIAFEAPALRLIARAAQGSMRDGLSLLDQAIAHGGGQRGRGSRCGRCWARSTRSYLYAICSKRWPAGDGAALIAQADQMAEPQPVVRGRAAGAGGAAAPARAVRRPCRRGADRTIPIALGCRRSPRASRRRICSSTIRSPCRGAAISASRRTSTRASP